MTLLTRWHLRRAEVPRYIQAARERYLMRVRVVCAIAMRRWRSDLLADVSRRGPKAMERCRERQRLRRAGMLPADVRAENRRNQRAARAAARAA